VTRFYHLYKSHVHSNITREPCILQIKYWEIRYFTNS